jgi:predicted transcriptional regulator
LAAVPAPPHIPELERRVMEEVWRQEQATVRSVLDALNAEPGQPERAYTTVLTILQRLDAKGMVRRSRHGRSDVYAPALAREAYLDARADAEVSELLEEYGELALVQFARRVAALDPARRAALRRLAGDG